MPNNDSENEGRHSKNEGHTYKLIMENPWQHWVPISRYHSGEKRETHEQKTPRKGAIAQAPSRNEEKPNNDGCDSANVKGQGSAPHKNRVPAFAVVSQTGVEGHRNVTPRHAIDDIQQRNESCKRAKNPEKAHG